MASSEMAGEDIPATPTTTRNRRPAESGPFVLRSLLDEVPLSADGGKEDIRINCVDYLGMLQGSLRLLRTKPANKCLRQTPTSMSEPLPRSSSTSFRSQPIPKTMLVDLPLSSRRDCGQHSPSPQAHRRVRSPAYNRYCSYQRLGRRACYATGR